MDEAQVATAAPRRRRPAGVVVVTIGLLLTGLSAGLVAWAALQGESIPLRDVPLLGDTVEVVALGLVPPPVAAGVAGLVSVLAFVVAVGFFLLRSWGWTGLMLLAAVSLTINLVAVEFNGPNEGSMLVAIAAVLYANQRRIQLLFRGSAVSVFEQTGSDVRSGG